MNKLLVILAGILVVFELDNIKRFFRSQEDYSHFQQSPVVLYATAWCGYCKKARQFLADYNIEYIEYDIEKSKEGKAQYDELGGRGVPVFLVNNQVVKGYDPNQVLAYLNPDWCNE